MTLQSTERSRERVDVHVMQQRRESGLLVLAGGFANSHEW
jgi:hypothetical protein